MRVTYEALLAETDVRPMKTNEPTHDKTYNKTCVTSKDSDQPAHPPSMAKALVYPSLDSLEAIESTCDQHSDQTARMRRLI